MSLNIQNNVAMPQNQMAFKSKADKKVIEFMKKHEQPYKPNVERARGEFIQQVEFALDRFEKSEVGKTLKSITDRFNKHEISAKEAQEQIMQQIELIG